MGAFFLPLSLLTLLVTFIAPGLAIGIWLHTKAKLKSWYILPVALVTGGLLGYITFYLYVANVVLGDWLATIVAIVSWIIAAWVCIHPTFRKVLIKPDVIIPLALIFGTSLFYNSIALSCRTDEFSRSCYTSQMPLDNDISQTFAQNVRADHPKERIGDWQGSDRPPLQTGVILSHGLFTADKSIGTANSQLLSSLLQCFWVVAIWALGRAIGLSKQRALLVILLCLFSGFFFFNSVLVWPKLLAASYVLLTFSLLFFEKPSRTTWVLASLAGGAALLSHTGIAFTLIPIILVALSMKRYRPHWKTILIAATCLIVLTGSWMAYQKFYDPPGDRLSKWFFAGVVAIDGRSVPRAVVDTYSETTIDEVFKTRVDNLSLLFGRTPPDDKLLGNGVSAQMRDGEFRYLLFSLVILNIGWIGLLSQRIRQNLKLNGILDHFKVFAVIIGLSLLGWILALFSPNMAVNHQGSYATILLLFVLLATIVTYLPRKLLLVVLGIQITYFMAIWVIVIALQNPTMKLYTVVTALSLVIIAGFLYKNQSLKLWVKEK